MVVLRTPIGSIRERDIVISLMIVCLFFVAFYALLGLREYADALFFIAIFLLVVVPITIHMMLALGSSRR